MESFISFRCNLIQKESPVTLEELNFICRHRFLLNLLDALGIQVGTIIFQPLWQLHLSKIMQLLLPAIGGNFNR